MTNGLNLLPYSIKSYGFSIHDATLQESKARNARKPINAECSEHLTWHVLRAYVVVLSRVPPFVSQPKKSDPSTGYPEGT